MSAPDDFARQRDIDRLDRAVEDMRAQMRADDRRRDSLREADNFRHDAEHKTIEERMDRDREAHDAEHEAEQRERSQGVQRKRDTGWTRGIALAACAAGVASAWVAILVYLHGR